MATFDADSTAHDVVRHVDLAGRRAIVTGAASGIGVETARALAGAGAEVTLAVRNVEAGEKVAEDIRRSEDTNAVVVEELDLADLASIDRFVERWDGPLDILINNAGVMETPLQRTADGWELQLGVNHLGHFALTTGLHSPLAAAENARVVAVSSSGHATAGIDFDDPHFIDRDYDPGVAYGQSKTANVLFAVEAGRRWKDDGIIVKALMPGGIWTNLQRHWPAEQLERMQAEFPGKTLEQGASTSVFVAVDPSVTADGPVYFEDNRPADIVPAITDGLHGVVPHALDVDTARKLWEFSEREVAQARERRQATA